MDRRRFLIAGALAGPAASGSGLGYAPVAKPMVPALGPPETLGALLNCRRASDYMRRAGLDAVLVTSPLNVYYTTNAVPVLSRFTPVHTAAAIVPADAGRPIAYLTDGFEFYAGVADSGLALNVQPYLVSGAFAGSSSVSPAFVRAGSYAFDAREQYRRAALEKAAPFDPDMKAAAMRALKERGLQRGRIGVDSADARALLEQAAPRATIRSAEDLMLHIRLVKTPAELTLMRRAAQNNVSAALIAARAAREVNSVWGLRQRFYQEASARGNLGVYGSVDLVMSELADGTFREGQAFMIDFVSHYAFYQGDYGRTVFFGEPDPQIKRATEVGAAAWREIRENLRPGVKFSDIHRIGNLAVQKMGEQFSYAFNPHSVGLQHWDQPRRSVDGQSIDLELEAGMILSVDCPLMNAGVDGTTHIEDLTLITQHGSEPLHSVTDDTITV